jgi:hypothetical protein
MGFDWDLSCWRLGWLRAFLGLKDSCKLIEWRMALGMHCLYFAHVYFIYHHGRYDLINLASCKLAKQVKSKHSTTNIISY